MKYLIIFTFVSALGAFGFTKSNNGEPIPVEYIDIKNPLIIKAGK